MNVAAGLHLQEQVYINAADMIRHWQAAGSIKCWQDC